MDNVASLILGDEFLSDTDDDECRPMSPIKNKWDTKKNKIRVILGGKSYQKQDATTTGHGEMLEEGEIYTTPQPLPYQFQKPRKQRRRRPRHRVDFWPPTHHFDMIDKLLDDYHENDAVGFGALSRNFDEYNARPNAFTGLDAFTDFYGPDLARDMIIHSISTNGTLRAKFNKLRRRNHPYNEHPQQRQKLFF